MSGLVDHARNELELIGEDPEVIEQCLKVVQAFADMGHSGESAAHFTGVFNELFQMNNLSELTDDPNEWIFHDKEKFPPDGIWQNKRNSTAFSKDGGKTYSFLYDRGTRESREKVARG